MKFFKTHGWLGAILLGGVLFFGGIFTAYQGQDAKRDVLAALEAERIVTAEDASIPSEPVRNAATARAQADAIKKHVDARTEGKSYAELDRDDPLRETVLRSVTLRTALMQAYMGLKIAELVQGLGVLLVLLGGSHVALGVYLGLDKVARK